MFQVHKDWEFPAFGLMSGDGTKAYRFVRVALHTYKFWVEHTVKDDKIELCEQTLVSSIQDLLAVINEVKDCKINLITPHYASENGETSMTTINQIYRCNNESQIGFLYNCSNSRSYFDSLSGNDEQQFTQKELLYPVYQKNNS